MSAHLPSIERRLVLGLGLAIALVALVAGWLSYRGALEEAHELQDATLRQVAALLEQAPTAPLRLRHGLLTDVQDVDPEAQLIVQRLHAPHAEPDALALPAELPDGLHTLAVAGVSYRVFVRTAAPGGRLAVAQQTRVRDEVAQDSAWRTVLPLLVLLPALWLLAVWLVRTALAPVATLAAQVDARASDALHPLPTPDLPREVRPFVLAINGLLARVQQAMQAQQRFVADAAHELRSPLTALSLQAERLAAAQDLAQARERLAPLRQGIERARRLLAQMLALAHAQSEVPVADAPSAPSTPVSPVFRQVLEELLPLAQARRVDLGIREGSADVRVAVPERDLYAIVRNLADNAVRYVPEGGRVDLLAVGESERVVIEVEDDGPGIAEDERQRVLAPFYRVPGSQAEGSGLGLSIVQTLAERWGGRVELLGAAQHASGVRARVVLPRAGAAQSQG